MAACTWGTSPGLTWRAMSTLAISGLVGARSCSPPVPTTARPLWWPPPVGSAPPRKSCAPGPPASIRDASSKIGISVDGFGPFDDAYRATVRNYFRALHAAGKFRLRTVRLPYLERTGEFIVEGLVEGECPVCLATCRGGLCETCCHPNNFFELLNPHSTVDPTEVPVSREATVLVLPMEDYRAELTAYHQQWARYWRPHMVQMVEDVLSRPLADLPITYPLSWGMPAPFPETPGQVLNAWLELIPAGMFTSSYCAARLGRQTSPGQLWLPEESVRIVHFLGFDNAYFFCLAHMALLMAHGDKYVRPEWVLTNEFYELESEKFSTSKGHVLSVQELLRDVPRDLARLYLALTAPEYQRTTFSRSGLEKVAETRLVQPWNQLATTLRRGLDTRTDDSPLPVSAAGRGRAGIMVDRFDHCYEMPNYSLNRSADTILVHVARLRASACRLEGRRIDDEPEAWGDLFLEVSALLALAAPVLIDLSDAAQQAGAFDGTLCAGAFDLTEIRPFVPPLLPARPASTRNRVSSTAGLG